MATQISTSAIVRRGASNLPAADIIYLVEHKREVARIIKDIDTQRDAFVTAKGEATAALEALAAAQMAVAGGQAALVTDRTDWAVACAGTAEQQALDTAALDRREREVGERETAHAERVAALPAEIAAITTAKTAIVEFRERLNASIAAFHPDAKPTQRKD